MKTENELSVINPVQFGLEEIQANELTKDLTTIVKEREILIEAYEDVMLLEITEENIPMFKSLRLQIRDNRTKGIEKWHKTNKAYFLSGGRFVDATKNKEIEVNERMEKKLLDAEKHFENLEKEKLEKLNADRILLVSPYLEDTEGLFLADMEEDIFQAYLSTKIKNFNDKIEAEKKVEAERLAKIEAERAENERIRIENDKLKKESEAKEALRVKENKERLAKEKIENDKRAKVEAEKQKVLDLERKKQEAILLKEREEKAKLEAELNAKQEAELKAKSDQEAKELKEKLEAEKLAKAPVKNQLKSWVNSFEIASPPMSNDVSLDVMQKFESFKKWAKSEIENL